MSLYTRVMDVIATNAVHFGVGYFSGKAGFRGMERIMNISRSAIESANGEAGLPVKQRRRTRRRRN